MENSLWKIKWTVEFLIQKLNGLIQARQVACVYLFISGQATQTGMCSAWTDWVTPW